MWQAFFVSTGVVALGEIGDKTQLLALLLAARFRKPVPIILGILVATLANHAGASALGSWITRVIDPQWLRWVLGASFLAVAAWMLIPDKVDDVEAERHRPAGRVRHHRGRLLPGRDGRQDADRHRDAGRQVSSRSWVVTAGTTLGMMIANVPAVLLGDRVVRLGAGGVGAPHRRRGVRACSACWCWPAWGSA